MFSIKLGSYPQKYLKKLSAKDRRRIADKIDQIETDPFAPNLDIKKLKDRPIGYRVRVGDLRILMTIDQTAKKIFIFRIRSRGDVYK